MADIFRKEDISKLFKGKRVVFFGDSNMRRLYKDVVWLLNDNSLISKKCIEKKGEYNYRGDVLITQCALTRGRDYEENRRYLVNGFDIEFFFITRCINKQIRKYLHNVKSGNLQAPDVMVMNSTFWDITRWGPKGVQQFRNDLIDLMKFLKACIPDSTMVIWTTALPPGGNIWNRSLLVKQVEFLGQTLRFDVMEANLYARNVVVEYGFDVLDFHFHLRLQLHRRCGDGVHYKPLVVRLLTNVLLTHIALSWGLPLPKNVKNNLLDRYKSMVSDNINTTNVTEVSNEYMINSSLNCCKNTNCDVNNNDNYGQIQIVIKNENNIAEEDGSKCNKRMIFQPVQIPYENVNESLFNRSMIRDNIKSEGIHVVIKNECDNNYCEIADSGRLVINNEPERKRNKNKRKRNNICAVNKTVQSKKVKRKEQNKKVNQKEQNKKVNQKEQNKRNEKAMQMSKKSVRKFKRNKKFMNDTRGSYNRNYFSCNNSSFYDDYNSSYETTQMQNNGVQVWQNNVVQVWENSSPSYSEYNSGFSNNDIFLNNSSGLNDNIDFTCDVTFNDDYNNSYQTTQVQNNGVQVWQNNLSPSEYHSNNSTNNSLNTSPPWQPRNIINYDLEYRMNMTSGRQTATVIPFFSSEAQNFIVPRYNHFL